MGLAIKDLVPSKEIKIPDLKDKWLVVDTFNLLYQFLTTIRSRDGTPLQDSKGNITSHLVGLFARTTKLMDEGLKLAFVFDGTPPKLKQEERERRKALKAVAQKQYKIAVQEEKEDEGQYNEDGNCLTSYGPLINHIIKDDVSFGKLLGEIEMFFTSRGIGTDSDQWLKR